MPIASGWPSFTSCAAASAEAPKNLIASWLRPSRSRGEARERIEAMVATSNGFEIAERDLKQRGPGEFFGTRQHGDAAFSFAQPLRDHELLELARREAFAVAEDPMRANAGGRATGNAQPSLAEALSVWLRWGRVCE